MTVTAEQLLTAEDVALRWQLLTKQGTPNAACIYRMTRDGRLSAVRLGRYYRYRLSDLEASEAGGGTKETE